MATEVKRLRYFTGEFLEEPDFTLEQSYHRKMRYLHNEYLYTKGIVGGLKVTKNDDTSVKVSKGMALVMAPFIEGEDDTQVLREVVVYDDSTSVVVSGAVGETFYITLELDETKQQGLSNSPNTERRWQEAASLLASKQLDEGNDKLILAKIILDGDGKVQANNIITDGQTPLIRRMATMRSNELTFMLPGNIDEGKWPRIWGGIEPNRLQISSDITEFTGDVKLGGSLTLPDEKEAKFVKAYCTAVKLGLDELMLTNKKFSVIEIKPSHDPGDGQCVFKVKFDSASWDDDTKSYPVVNVTILDQQNRLFCQVKEWDYDNAILKFEIRKIDDKTPMVPDSICITIY